ncbi:MAG: sodium:solute symporter [Kiritimatiellia bacterium]
MSAVDHAIIAVYLAGTTLFGCSFYFRRKGGGARAFMTGGGTLPTWAIALSVFATFVSSISFLALPEGAFGPEGWRGWVNSITVPIATVFAAIWFVPFYRRATSVSAYSFLEERFGVWARIYASVCFLVMQSMRSGVILLLLAILVNQLLGFSCETIIVVTGLATMLYSMLGGFSAVVWADAVQSLVLIGGTLVCIVCLLLGIPDLPEGFRAAFSAGKMSMGAFTVADWSTNTFWVMFAFSICINLQNLGIDQCYTQRYIAARDERSARRSIFVSAWLYLGVTLLFTLIGTLLWMFDRVNPGVIPEGVRAAAVFPWYIIHRLPVGVSGLMVSAIIAAAMSTIAATLNSGSSVLLEDYWKRFAKRWANEGSNLLFLRFTTVALAVFSIAIALGIFWFADGMSVLSVWWTILSVFSGGMLGLSLIGAFSRGTRSSHALLATAVGFLLTLWVTVGQQALPLPIGFHPNLSIVFATLSIVLIGFTLGACMPGPRTSANKRRGQTLKRRGQALRDVAKTGG